MERSKLKPSDTQKNLHNRNEKIAQLNIEEAFITILSFSQNDYQGQVNKTHIQLKEYRPKIHKKHALLRNNHGFKK